MPGAEQMTEMMCSEKRATDTGLGIELPADELAGASTGFFKMPHSNKNIFKYKCLVQIGAQSRTGYLDRQSLQEKK